MPSWWKRLNRVDEKRWEKVRRLGFFGFVMVFGLGIFGLGGGVLNTAIFTLAFWGLKSLPELLAMWTFSLGMWLAGGVWFGLLMWFWGERQYKRQLRETGREPAPLGSGDPDAG